MPSSSKSKRTPTKPLTQTKLFQNLNSGSQIMKPNRNKASQSQSQARKRRHSPTPPPAQADSDSDAGDMKFEPKKAEENSDLEIVTPHSTQKRRRVVDSDEDSSGGGGSPVPKASSKAKGKQKAVEMMDISSEDTDEEDASPVRRKRKLVRGKRPPTPVKDDSDSSDALEDKNIIKDRFRTRDKRTEFQKNLEKLKRKKQGKSPTLSSDEDDEEGETQDESDASSHNGIIKGARPSSEADSLFGDDEENDEDSWIVHDDGEKVELPTAFSMDARQDLAHQFKKIYQFFVHIAVQKPKARRKWMQNTLKSEEYFSVPLAVARRKITGLRDSLVTSSVWRPDYKKALETYPDISLSILDFSTPHCDACHLGGRVSTIQGRLSGSAYEAFGFQDVREDSSDEDSDESSEPKKKLKTEFALGKFCARRTRVFHSLSHWEYALFSSIVYEVDHLRGGGNFINVGFGGTQLKQPKDLDDADEICEWLDQRKKIDAEWQLVKQKMEDAQHLEVASKRGDADD